MSNQTLIKSVSVRGLFNKYDYDIDYENEDNVSIFIAPNGCGKTTIFNLINFIFNPDFETYELVKTVPFDRFTCTLNNGKSIVLSGELSQIVASDSTDDDEDAPQEARNFNITIYESRGGNFIEKENICLFPLEDISSLDNLETERFDEISISRIERARNLQRRRRHDADAVFYGIKHMLRENGISLNVELIGTNRLTTLALKRKHIGPSRMRELNKAHSLGIDMPNVKYDALDEIRDDAELNMRKCMKQYKDNLFEANNNLPNLFLNKNYLPDEMTLEDFTERWNNYKDELARYAKLGLLSKTAAYIDFVEDDFQGDKKNFLIIYLKLFEDALYPIRDLYNKLKIFADIINQRNETTGKVVTFDDAGLHISSDNREIDLEKLSSGEKHDLVMFYRLIFMTKPGSIILIDEPEISLHISWQESYMDELLDVCKTSNLQAIVATHSPHIVNGHFDLYAKLDE